MNRDTADRVKEFKARGCAIFERLLPDDLVKELYREHMAGLLAKQRSSRIPLSEVLVEFDEARREGGNHDHNRWNMHLPSRYPFLDPRVIANPAVHDMLDQIFGEELSLDSIVSENAFPKAANQGPHQDEHTATITVNILLVDTNELNAPTEIWPGTHLPKAMIERGEYDFDQHDLSRDDIARARSEIKSERMIYPAGTVFVRDHRMLHRGTINRSNEVRPMLALLHRVGPSAVPYRAVADRVGDWLKRERHKIWKSGTGPIDYDALNVLNVSGGLLDLMRGSDRDHTRRIPANIWAELPPRAKRLLRYAQVEGGLQPGQPDVESLDRTLLMLRVLPVELALTAGMRIVEGLVRNRATARLDERILGDLRAGGRRAQALVAERQRGN